MKNFEQRLERLEQLGTEIKKTDIKLEDALKLFEEGIWKNWKKNWIKSREKFSSL